MIDPSTGLAKKAQNSLAQVTECPCAPGGKKGLAES